MPAADSFSAEEDRSMHRLDRRSTLTLLAGCVLMPLAGCKIVRNKDKKKSGAGAFDADAYVEGIWDSKVTPLVRDKATEIAAVLDALAKDPDAAGTQFGNRAEAEGAQWNFIVKGKGKVTKA